jgi:hypothetical protein
MLRKMIKKFFFNQAANNFLSLKLGNKKSSKWEYATASLSNKKADERYLSPWMFLVWALIGIGIVVGLIIFYSATVDVRNEEARILNKKVIDCIADQGYLKDLSNFDLYKECSLNKNLVENGNLYFIEIKVLDSNNKEVLTKEYGVKGWKEFCSLQQSNKKQENLPQCSETIFSISDNKNSKVKVDVVTASNQLGTKL